MWKQISIEVERAIECKNSYKFYMPVGVGFDGYSFFHPIKLVEWQGCYVLTVKDSWQFKLTKSEKIEEGVWEVVDEVMLALDEMEALLSSTPLLHTPPLLDPLEDVEALEDLLDE